MQSITAFFLISSLNYIRSWGVFTILGLRGQRTGWILIREKYKSVQNSRLLNNIRTLFGFCVSQPPIIHRWHQAGQSAENWINHSTARTSSTQSVHSSVYEFLLLLNSTQLMLNNENEHSQVDEH